MDTVLYLGEEQTTTNLCFWLCYDEFNEKWQLCFRAISDNYDEESN